MLFSKQVGKQEFGGQKLLNKQILDKIKDLEEREDFYKKKYEILSKSLRSLNIFIQDSYKPNGQYCLIQYTNLEGKPDIRVSDISNISQEELKNLLKILRQSTNVTIANL